LRLFRALAVTIPQPTEPPELATSHTCHAPTHLDEQTNFVGGAPGTLSEFVGWAKITLASNLVNFSSPFVATLINQTARFPTRNEEPRRPYGRT
jgi:hypothetical protein